VVLAVCVVQAPVVATVRRMWKPVVQRVMHGHRQKRVRRAWVVKMVIVTSVHRVVTDVVVRLHSDAIQPETTMCG
jgi:hypothetical protein